MEIEQEEMNQHSQDGEETTPTSPPAPSPKKPSGRREESSLEISKTTLPDRNEISERQPSSIVPDGKTIRTMGEESLTVRDKIREELKSSKEVLHEWAEGTSVHGINYALDENYFLWKRLAWFFLLLVAVIVLLWQIFLLLDQYRSYKTTTTIETKYPLELEFPDVTVCNTNMFQQSKVDATNITDPKTEAEIWMLAQTREAFISNAAFNSEAVTDSDENTGWRNVITPHGPCFTFSTDQTVTAAGYLAGLSFTMDIQQAEHIYPGVMEGGQFAGALLFVHQKKSSVADGSPFVLVGPGVSTFIGVNEVHTNRKNVEPKPYEGCRGEGPSYTQPGCRTDCFNKFLLSRCECVYFGSPAFKGTEVPICSPTDECYLAEELTDEEFDSCDCDLPPCLETSYGTRTSQLDFSQAFLESEAEEYETTIEDYKNDIATISVNFVAIERSVVTVSRAMTYTQLLSNIGGQMGLFVGMSAISLVEVLGELVGLRMLPRLWGDRRMYGVGGVR